MLLLFRLHQELLLSFLSSSILLEALFPVYSVVFPCICRQLLYRLLGSSCRVRATCPLVSRYRVFELVLLILGISQSGFLPFLLMTTKPVARSYRSFLCLCLRNRLIHFVVDLKPQTFKTSAILVLVELNDFLPGLCKQ